MPIIDYQVSIGCEHLNQNQQIWVLKKQKSHFEKIRDGIIWSGGECKIDIRELVYTIRFAVKVAAGYVQEVRQFASRAPS